MVTNGVTYKAEPTYFGLTVTLALTPSECALRGLERGAQLTMHNVSSVIYVADMPGFHGGAWVIESAHHGSRMIFGPSMVTCVSAVAAYGWAAADDWGQA